MQATPSFPSVDAPTEHLLLVDGLNVVRRVYEANLAPDSEAKAEAAVRSSVGSLRRALDEHKPTHALVVFDHGGTTWRHALYAAYRSKRKPMPQVLRDALPDLFVKLKALGLVTLSVPEVEADDVLVCVAKRWDQKRGPVTVLSTDKDLASLIADGVRVHDHFGRVARDDAWVQGKFGVPAAQLLDLLALTGDSADDVPGVPDVGVKTAAKWLTAYGSLDGVLAAAEAIKGKTGEKLRDSVDVVRLARQLVSFKTDLSLGLTWNALRLNA